VSRVLSIAKNTSSCGGEGLNILARLRSLFIPSRCILYLPGITYLPHIISITNPILRLKNPAQMTNRVREDIDNFMRHKAIDENRKFSDILDDCLQHCFGKEMEKTKKQK
jgi:hypothetical protein